MKTHSKSLLLSLCAGALLLAGPAFGENPAKTDRPNVDGSGAPIVRDTTDSKSGMDMKLPRADQRFFKKAAHLGETEVTLSRVAAERANNPQVRTFASEMVSAHTSANSELASLGRQKGAVVDDTNHATEQRELSKKWNDKKADDFDEDYLDAMIAAHKDTIDVLEKGAKSKDMDIAAYSQKMLPTVKAHLAHAKQLEDLVD